MNRFSVYVYEVLSFLYPYLGKCHCEVFSGMADLEFSFWDKYSYHLPDLNDS